MFDISASSGLLSTAYCLLSTAEFKLPGAPYYRVQVVARPPAERLLNLGRVSHQLRRIAGPARPHHHPDGTAGDALRRLDHLPHRVAAPGGHIVTTSLPRGMLTLPAVMFTIGGRTHHAGQAGGCSPMKDIPRFVALLESGKYDAKSLATRVVPLADMRDAYEEVLYRTTVTAIMTA